MTASRKILIAGFGVALASAVVVALFATNVSSPTVRMLDQRFRVHDMKTSHGTHHRMFYGNQIEGSLRESLQRIGLPIKQLPKTTQQTGTNSFAFLACYSGDFPPAELIRVRAELVDRTGTVTPLESRGGYYNRLKREWLRVWILDAPLTGPGPFRVKLRHPGSGVDLLHAEFDKP